jgi:hypothetical protein
MSYEDLEVGEASLLIVGVGLPGYPDDNREEAHEHDSLRDPMKDVHPAP